MILESSTRLYLSFFITLCAIVYLFSAAWKREEPFVRGFKYIQPTTSVPGVAPKSGFVIVAIFKDEAMTIAEWVSHYRWQGALHFYLIDNGSTDNGKAKLGSRDGGDVTVVTREAKYKQIEHYNSYIPLLRERHAHDWALVVDIDEYLYPTLPEKNLASYFASVPSNVDQVSIAWKMFGSSGFRLQPESIRCSFLWRGYNATSPIKSAIRVSSLEKFVMHWHEGKQDNLIGHPFHTILEERLQLNHYPIQSVEYFERVKLSRGDAATVETEHVRNWDYYNRYDDLGTKQQDTELCTILNCCNITLVENRL